MQTPITLFPTKTLKLDDNIEISYIDEGKGKETILFVHGLASMAEVWSPNIAELKSKYRCIAIDLPGNGNSSGGDLPYTMLFYSICIEKFLELLNIDKVVLCGHSMGGQVSVIYYLRNSAKVSKMVLAAPAGLEHFTSSEKQLFKGMVTMGQYMYADPQQLTAMLKDGFYHSNHETSQLIDMMKNAGSTLQFGKYHQMMSKSMIAMMDEPIQEFLPQIKCPVLLIFGKKDQWIPNRLFHHYNTQQVADEAIKHIVGAQLVMIDNCGHFLQWEAPQKFNREVQLFLE